MGDKGRGARGEGHGKGPLTWRTLGLVGLLGAVGGAINAALCDWEFPVPVAETYASFEWHSIPAGAWHGGLLAVIAVGCTTLLWKRGLLAR